jgi:aryl-alcohol dehydrogenase-like predicted oxidoreductase
VTLKNRLSRRAFLRGGLGLAAVAWAAGPMGLEAVVASDIRIPTRPLGRTGLEVSCLGFGASQIGGLPENKAVPVLEAALDEGITYINTASSYGDSEAWIGRALSGVERNSVILATKAIKRSRDEARREIERSLKRLRIDRIDVLQLHAVNSPDILRRILAPDGALRAAVEFKEAGQVSFIGITGHRRAAILVEALEAYPFDTALVPINPADAHLHDFVPPLERVVRQKGLGLIATKVLAAGAWADHSQRCLHYALSKPVACALIGMASVTEVRINAAAARAFRPMTPEEKIDLETVGRERTFSLWWKH